jgi:nicotinamidase-related amidase
VNLPFPSFYDASKVADLFCSRSKLVAAVARQYAKDQNIKPAYEDKFKIAVFGIDTQIDFCLPFGSLFVPGAVEDSVRTCEFIYRNLDVITSLNFSLDTHKLFQIFHPAWWLDTMTGDHPEDFTMITAQSIRDGRYQPLFFAQESIEYCEELERTGKYVLIGWPFHTLLGSVGHAMVPAIFEAAVFHAIARRKQTHFETKGLHPLTENYSVLSPEVKKVRGRVVGQFNTDFFKALMTHDRVYILGQASSHCVKTTIEDLLREIMAIDPSLVDKVYIVEDCMSPVPAVRDPQGNVIVDFPKIAADALDSFRQAGMHVVKSTDAITF